MDKERLEFLRKYMGVVCPTGFEEDAARVWREEAGAFAERTWVDVHGNAYAVINEGAPRRVMLAGHADEIGLMVTYIDDDGFLFFTGLGGWDPQILPGQRVRLRTKSGTVYGVIGRKPIHLLREEDRKNVVKMDDLWIDIGAKDKADAASVVRIGDPAVLDYDFGELRNGLLMGRGFDDRIGAFVVLEALRLLSDMEPSTAVYAVATVQEEIGLRGAQTSAFGIDPYIGIAVDVGFATDTPAMADARKKFGEAKMGGGPIITRGPNISTPLYHRLVETAEEHDIPHQIEGYPRGTGTDANAIQLTRSGVVTGLLNVPNRYMHSPCELVHAEDVENTAKLMAYAVAGITDDDLFLPG